MDDQSIQLPWERPGWLDEATAWILDRLSDYGLQPAGPVEILHQRAWSAFGLIQTAGGAVYFKAPAPKFKFEAALTQALARWRPDCTVRLIAVSPEHGWMLSTDAGETLRSLDRTPGQIAHWLEVMPVYAAFQIQMAARMPDLLPTGIPDRRLADLPRQYALLLEDVENLRVGLTPGLTAAQHRRLGELQDRFEDDCAELAGMGLPETLVHEEVHENNVLFGDGRYILTDWSDSSVGHPFFTILVTLRSIAHWLQLDESGPEVTSVRDAYIEPWTIFTPRNELLHAFDLAYRLAMVNRALSWREGIGALSPQAKEAYLDSVPGWLQDYLEAAEPGKDL